MTIGHIITRRLSIFAALACVTGCGSWSVASSMHRAKTSLDTARSVDADSFAPYELTAAAEYYDKAQECRARADFHYADRFARRSYQYSQAAIAKKQEPLLMTDSGRGSPSVRLSSESRP